VYKRSVLYYNEFNKDITMSNKNVYFNSGKTVHREETIVRADGLVIKETLCYQQSPVCNARYVYETSGLVTCKKCLKEMAKRGILNERPE
jgi:hypothetical protein